MPTPFTQGDGLVALATIAANWHLNAAEARALLNERGVQILHYSVSGRKVELVNEREANAAILAHVTPAAPFAGEDYTPLTKKLEGQAKELEKLKADVAAIKRGLGVAV